MGIFTKSKTIVKQIHLVLRGYSLNGSKLGEEIDSHPVIRIPHPTKMKEEDVGSRYDFGILSGPWPIRRLEPLFKFTPQKEWWMYFLHHQKQEKFKFTNIKNVSIKTYESRLDRMFFTRQKSPTRGLLAIEMACTFYPECELHIFGGDSLKTGEITKYYNGKSNKPAYDRHDYSYENEVLKKSGYINRIVWRT